MHQSTFFDLASEHKKKVTRKQRFLNEMDAVLPWLLFKPIRKRYPRAGRGISSWSIGTVPIVALSTRGSGCCTNDRMKHQTVTLSTRGSGLNAPHLEYEADSDAIHARVGFLNKRKNLLKLLKRFGTTSSRD